MREYRTARRRAGGLVALAFLLASCGGAEVDRVAAPEPPPSFQLTLREYSFTPAQDVASIPAGRVNFDLFNDGEQGHQPALIFVPDDFPPMAEQVRGDQRRPVRILVGNPGISPGVTAALAVDLEAGRRYAFLCLAQDAESKQHSLHGMAWEFRTPPAGEAEQAAPEADART